MSRYLKISEVAERLQLHPKRVYPLITSGKLPAANISAGLRPVYRVRLEDLEAFMGTPRKKPPRGRRRAKSAAPAAPDRF